MAGAAAADVAATYAAVAAGSSTTVTLFDHHAAKQTSDIEHFALILPGLVGTRKQVVDAINKQSAVHGRKYVASGNVSLFKSVSHAVASPTWVSVSKTLHVALCRGQLHRGHTPRAPDTPHIVTACAGIAWPVTTPPCYTQSR